MTRPVRPFAATLPLLLLLALAPVPAAGAEAFLADPSSGNARRPRVGEWLTYVVAYRVDPLEHSLRPDSLRQNADSLDNESAPLDVPAIWRTTPLRIVIQHIEEKSCRVLVTHRGVSRETTLPLDAAMPDYEYDDDNDNELPPPTAEGRHRLRGQDIPVTITSRTGPTGGFVRYYSPDVPFGVVRFASEDVDVILVEYGIGQPSERLPLPSDIVPPPGALYKP